MTRPAPSLTNRLLRRVGALIALLTVLTVSTEIYFEDAEDEAAEDHSFIGQLQNPEVHFLVGFGVILMLLVGVTIQRSLRPLHRASAEAARIGPTATDQRLPTAGMPHEVMPLVDAVNLALDRLEIGFRRQREFTADAAHELRTPLAVLQANIDTLPDAALKARLVGDVARMSRLVSQLLQVSRMEDLSVAPGGSVDLLALARETTAYLAPAAIVEGRSIEIDGEAPNLVPGDAGALDHALRNLIENALQHTPAGSVVTVDATAPGRLTVRDRGPGVPLADREAIFRRFWRAPERRTDWGAGLGLAIVARVAAAHGGRVTVDDAPGGGAAFTLELPVPVRPSARSAAEPAPRASRPAAAADSPHPRPLAARG